MKKYLYRSIESVFDAIDLKDSLARELEKLLNKEQIKRALNDPHSKRKPRPCGMTIHTGIGCSFRCIYCYIEDMGFPWTIKPYPLSGLELVYALVRNPYFIPGRYGTLIAIGSVTEPFTKETREKSFEYIEHIARYLGNPIQFSTKAYLSINDAKRLAHIDKGISPLITIISLKHSNKLEPFAPSPEKRLETIRNLSSQGLKPILFYRPVIPGINDTEYKELLSLAKKNGAIGVVVGSLRVTRLIISRLKTVGFNIDPILKRIPRMPKGHEQVSVNITDIKKTILRYAKTQNLVPFPMACMANLYTHERTCWPMKALGIEIGEKPRDIDFREIKEVAKYLGLMVEDLSFDKKQLKLKLRGSREKIIFFKELIRSYYAVCTR